MRFARFAIVLILFYSNSFVNAQNNNLVKDTIYVAKDELDALLFLHCDSGNIDKAKILIELGANPNLNSIHTTFFNKYFSSFASIKDINEFTFYENNQKFVFPNFNSLLHCAVLNNDTSITRLLLNYKADVNSVNGEEITPLHLAAWNGLTKISEILLANGADPNIRTKNFNTALHYASMSGNDSIAELLIKHNAFTNVYNDFDLTPLHYSVWNGYPFLTELLLFNGANVNSKDKYGFTPLMLSVYNGTYLSANILLEYGANPNQHNNDSITPLMLAAQFNDTAMVNLLLDYNADITLVDKTGFNALAHAITSNSNQVVKLLVEHGAAEQKLSKSYYQLAAECSYNKMRLLDSLGLKSKLDRGISNYFVGTNTVFNNHEFMWGFVFGITERTTNLSASLGFKYRPFPVATLRYRGDAVYQFNEKRQVLELKVNKTKNIKHFSSGSTLNLYYGGGLDLIFRDFRGTNSDPRTAIYPSLNAGFAWGSDYAKLLLGWEYTGLRTPDVTPHRVGFHLNIYFPVKKYIRKTYINHVD